MDGLTVLVIAEGLALAQDLNLAFRRHTGVTILGPTFDAQGARDLVTDGAVDVVVVDLDRSDDAGIALIEAIRSLGSVAVLGCSRSGDATLTAHVLAAGGAGMLSRDIEPRAVLSTLHQAAASQVALPVAWRAGTDAIPASA